MTTSTDWRTCPVSSLGFNSSVTAKIEQSGCENLGQVADNLEMFDTFKLDPQVLENVKLRIAEAKENGLPQGFGFAVPIIDRFEVLPEPEPKPKRSYTKKAKPEPVASVPAESDAARSVRMVKGLLGKMPDSVLLSVLPMIGEISEAVTLAGGEESFKALIEILK